MASRQHVDRNDPMVSLAQLIITMSREHEQGQNHEVVDVMIEHFKRTDQRLTEMSNDPGPIDVLNDLNSRLVQLHKTLTENRSARRNQTVFIVLSHLASIATLIAFFIWTLGLPEVPF